MRSTKIICTVGPASQEREVLKALADIGMDVARFNFSHGTHEEQKERIDRVKSIREECGKPIALLLDTKGPEIRTGTLKEGRKVQLTAGQTFLLTTEEVEGDQEKVQISYPGLPMDVKAGSRILIDDGLMELEVISTTPSEISCQIGRASCRERVFVHV